jgi:hypothetical protein
VVWRRRRTLTGMLLRSKQGSSGRKEVPSARPVALGLVIVGLSIASSRIDRAGVVTDATIPAGSLVHTMAGEQISLPTVCWRWWSGQFRSIDDPLELDLWHVLVLEPLSLAFNHSCEPNCGLRNLRDLHAIRDIAAGEELTYDYSLNARGIYFWWRMACRCKCGARSCRGVIGNIASVPRAAYENYVRLGVIPREFRISRRLQIGRWHMGI